MKTAAIRGTEQSRAVPGTRKRRKDFPLALAITAVGPYHMRHPTQGACQQLNRSHRNFSRNAARFCALILCFCAAAVYAQSPPPPPLSPLTIKGDPKRGEMLTYNCLGCHGVYGARNAYPSYRIPKLGGQNAGYIEVALQGYRRGTRKHPTMDAQASLLSDQDIADVAAFFSSIKGTASSGKSGGSAAEIAAGMKKASSCAQCHGAQGKAIAPQFPNLAGQHESYLLHALNQYKNGGRRDAIMGPMVAPLDAQAITDLAAFFASQRGLYVPKP